LFSKNKVAAKVAAPSAVKKEAKFYAADDVASPLPSRKSNHKLARLRASITPGTVLILLAGRFRGKRVVFLKQLPSGLLLVTGPYKVNGVPLRRVNQAYVIATSTKIDLGKVDLNNLTDDFFKRATKEKSKKDANEFFKEDKKSNVVSEARKSEQKRVDAVVLPKVQAVKNLKHYLNAKFSLTENLLPHNLKF